MVTICAFLSHAAESGIRRRLKAALARAEEEIARLKELLTGRDEDIRALREKLARPVHQVRVDPRS